MTEYGLEFGTDTFPPPNN